MKLEVICGFLTVLLACGKLQYPPWAEISWWWVVSPLIAFWVWILLMLVYLMLIRKQR